MPALPIEAPAGVQFGLFAKTRYITADGSDGVYTVDDVNGTVKLASAVASVRRLSLSAAAEASNAIVVTGQVQDHAGASLSEAATIKVQLFDDDMTLAATATVSAVGTGSAVSATGGPGIIVTANASGVFVFTVSETSAIDIHVVASVVNKPSEEAYVELEFA